MIRKINKIKNVGHFHSYEGGSPDQDTFEKLTLIFGPNGSGKTTLARIFRSLANDPTDLIIEQLEEADQHLLLDLQISTPHDGDENVSATRKPVIRITDDAKISYLFKNGTWTTMLPADAHDTTLNFSSSNIKIFDILFCSLFQGVQLDSEKIKQNNYRLMAHLFFGKSSELKKLEHEIENIRQQIFADMHQKEAIKRQAYSVEGEQQPREKCEYLLLATIDECNSYDKAKLAGYLKAEHNEERNILQHYKDKINHYLKIFNVDFRLESIEVEYHDPYPFYNLFGYNENFPRATVSFKYKTYALQSSSYYHVSKMSEGDRSTIALAFFLASLFYDYDKQNSTASPPPKPILVFDDPVSSFDSGRRQATIHTITDLLFNKTIAQAIVLSHDKYFLCDLLEEVNLEQKYIEKRPVRTVGFAITKGDIGKPSDLIKKNIKDLTRSPYSCCVAILKQYQLSGVEDYCEKVNVMINIRKVLEANLSALCKKLHIKVEDKAMCGTMIDAISFEVISTDSIVTEEEIIKQLRRINNQVSPAAHLESIDDIIPNELNKIEIDVQELHSLIRQTFDVIDNKLRLLELRPENGTYDPDWWC